MYVKLHSDYAKDDLAREAANIVKSCVHCGFCNASCPTYQEYFDERDGPRGRIYLIRHMLESGSAGVATRLHLDRCLTCRACETTCPSGVRYGRLVDIGRELVERETGRPVLDMIRRRFARLIFPYPRRVAALLTIGRWLRWLLPSQLKREIPPRQSLPVAFRRATAMSRKMIVLAGCVQAAATPRTNDAARRVLARLGIDLVDVPSAGCCGAVSYHLGAPQEGLDFMRRNIDAWWPYVEDGAEAIVISASGCGRVRLASWQRICAKCSTARTSVYSARQRSGVRQLCTARAPCHTARSSRGPSNAFSNARAYRWWKPPRGTCVAVRPAPIRCSSPRRANGCSIEKSLHCPKAIPSRS